MKVLQSLANEREHPKIRRRNVALAVGLLLVILVSVFYVAYIGTAGRTPGTTSSGITSISTSSTTTSESASSNNLAESDYLFFIQPNLARVEALREWFMSPFDLASQKAGYDPTFGMIRGGYWAAGFKDGFVLIDTQLILAKSLDYFNSVRGVQTTVESKMRSWLAGSFIEPSTGAVGTYNGTDRREVLFGKVLSCIRSDVGQVYYVNNHTLNDPVPITTALPASCSSDTQGGMNVYAPWIELYYLEGNTQKAQAMLSVTIAAWTPTPGTGVGQSTGGYFSDTFDAGPSQGKCKSSRILGYWLEMARATGYWNLNGQSRTIAEQVMNELWAHQETDGSISVNYPGCKNDTKASGESSGLTLVAFDPRVPSWFKPTAGISLQLSPQILPQHVMWISYAIQSRVGDFPLYSWERVSVRNALPL